MAFSTAWRAQIGLGAASSNRHGPATALPARASPPPSRLQPKLGICQVQQPSLQEASAAAPAPWVPCQRSHRRHVYAHSSKVNEPAISSNRSSTGSPLLDFVRSSTRLTTAAQLAWMQVVQPGDTVVDATCGNGKDTLALARAVGPTGRVYGFDVQAAAVESTQKYLASSLAPSEQPATTILQQCHSTMQQVVGSGVAKVVAFNLGYLPGAAADKAIITRSDSTIAAVEAALEVVCPGGMISICAYIGHPGGLEEYEAVKNLLAELPPSYWTCTETRLVNRPSAPILLLVFRGSSAAAAGAKP